MLTSRNTSGRLGLSRSASSRSRSLSRTRSRSSGAYSEPLVQGIPAAGAGGGCQRRVPILLRGNSPSLQGMRTAIRQEVGQVVEGPDLGVSGRRCQ
jgi:hypothetical protein